MPATASTNATPLRCESQWKEAIKIETRTFTKKLNIEWIINKKTMDIAKLSPNRHKKGVISTTMQYGAHALNFELCITGWKRSHRDHSAFYFTVPTEHDHGLKEDEHKEPPPEFVARYSISFQNGNTTVTRKSSTRTDFNLGVGFPNFTEQKTLFQAVQDNKLVLKIQIEIFERKSRVRQLPEAKQGGNAIAQLMSKMYRDKINADAVIIVDRSNGHHGHSRSPSATKSSRRIMVHRCVLTAASPVFHSFFKHRSAENETSSIVMDQWDEEIVSAMVRFLYLGRIEFDEHSKDECRGTLGRTESASDLDSLTVGGLDEMTPDPPVLETTEFAMEEVKQNQIGEEEGAGTSDPEAIGQKMTSKQMRETTKAEDLRRGKGVVFEDKGLRRLESECPQRVRRLLGLFQIAECYEIEELLVSCCCALRDCISHQSCVLLLLYLTKYEHLDFIKQINQNILDYTARNIKVVKKTGSYQYALQNKPGLIDNLIDRLAEREDSRIIV